MRRHLGVGFTPRLCSKAGQMAKPKRSPLVEAAEALDHVLERFEESALAAAKAPMSTQKQLEKAAKQLTAIADSDDEMQGAVKILVDAVAKARDRQLHHAE